GEILVNGESTIQGNGTVNVLLNAVGLLDDILLTLEGSAALAVINLQGNVDATALTGALTVTTADNLVDDTIAITTGSGPTTINGTANGAPGVNPGELVD